jgi:hypothetical protein
MILHYTDFLVNSGMEANTAGFYCCLLARLKSIDEENLAEGYVGPLSEVGSVSINASCSFDKIEGGYRIVASIWPNIADEPLRVCLELKMIDGALHCDGIFRTIGEDASLFSVFQYGASDGCYKQYGSLYDTASGELFENGPWTYAENAKDGSAGRSLIYLESNGAGISTMDYSYFNAGGAAYVHGNGSTEIDRSYYKDDGNLFLIKDAAKDHYRLSALVKPEGIQRDEVSNSLYYSNARILEAKPGAFYGWTEFPEGFYIFKAIFATFIPVIEVASDAVLPTYGGVQFALENELAMEKGALDAKIAGISAPLAAARAAVIDTAPLVAFFDSTSSLSYPQVERPTAP